MRCQINQEMLWPTNGQKQLFDNNMDSIEIHFKLQFSTCSFFWQYRGLALCTQRTIRGCFLEVSLTLKHCTISDKKGEIRPEQQKTLTCKIDLELFLVSSIRVDGLAGVVSVLVQTDSCSVCCIHQYCRVPYQCCV